MSAYLGVRVADFSQGVAGPLAAMFLAQLGAEVVKVEPPQGDRLRQTPAYLALNRDKSVVTLDLDSEDGMAAAHALIAGADVALFDDGPTRLQALGLDAERLAKAHPALIHAWMPPYGVDGVWSDLPAHHSLLSGLVGWGWFLAAETEVPVHLIPQLGWYTQGLLGAASIGAALYERTQSGQGQGVIVTGLHACSLTGNFARALDEPLPPRASTLGMNPRIRMYRCADGRFLYTSSLFPHFYRKTFEVLGYGELFDELVVDDEGARNLLEVTFANGDRDHWLKLLQDADVPCAPLETREAWFDSETVAQAGARLTLEHPTLGAVAMPGVTMEMSATPAEVRSFPQPIPSPPNWAPRRLAGRSQRRSGGPLAGVRVLNLGAVIAGALPNSILSHLGADVIKVEPLTGDSYRFAPVFLGFNRGSRSLSIDLTRPEGREAFLELARQADVVIDNYRPGIRNRLGLDYAALKAVNPRIISCSFSAYGFDGPRAREPGFDPLLQAEGGFMIAQGGDDDPVVVPLAPLDVGGATTICASVIAALHARERTGEGQEIRSSLIVQSLLYQLGELVTYAGRPENDKGGRDCLGLSALHRYYACADGWIGIACDQLSQAAALGVTLAVAIDDPRAALSAPRDGALANRIADALANRQRDEVLEGLLAASVPAAPVLRVAESLADPWLWRNGYFAHVEDAKLGRVLVGESYADMLGTPCGIPRPAPALGAHSVEVLREFGIPSERIAELVSLQVVRDGAAAKA